MGQDAAIRRGSREDVGDGVVFFHSREAEVQAAVSKVQLFVVESQAVQNGCLDVVNMDGIYHTMKAQLVGRSIADARFDASAR